MMRVCFFIHLFTCSFLSLIGQVHPVHFMADLKPFYHGVASGQPDTGGFVLWTRLSPDAQGQNIQWYLSESADMSQILQSGTVSAEPQRDFTARVRVTGLQPDRYYYYYFSHAEGNSLVGRAKTLPVQTEHLRFAVVSCSRFETGYFGAYGAIARRNDLDAVLHLGDYIYEYEQGNFISGRTIAPLHEAINLADYRTRYATYRLDSNLIRLHQQHTVISIWDDHESANNSYDQGAQNHQPSEGDWQKRKEQSRQAYHEWMPVMGDQTSPVYRRYRFGNLAQLSMLDTRLDGRQRQPLHFDDPDPTGRRIMSDTQFDWLIAGVKDTLSRWKILGNQIIFSDVNVGMFAGASDGQADPTNLDSIRVIEDTQNDFWEAYPRQRNNLLDTLLRHQIPGVVIVSGDSHASWIFDVAKQTVQYPLAQYNYLPKPNPFLPGVGGYDYQSRAGAVAVEFCTPSVTSPNFDESLGFIAAFILENALSAAPGPESYNPHLKWADLDRHGYIILNVRPDSVQADYFHQQNIQQPGIAENYTVTGYHIYGKPGAFLKYSPSANKTTQALPAPSLPFGVSAVPTTTDDAYIVNALFPNPAKNQLFLHVVAQRALPFTITIFQENGTVAQRMQGQTTLGSQFLEMDIAQLPAGVFMLQFSTERNQKSVRFVKVQ